MKKRLLVVVDMVNGFINEGALADKGINKITPNILKLMDKAKEKNIPIVAFRDCHEMTDAEFKIYPPHCLKGTSESDFIPELKNRENDFSLIIDKNTTNGFITCEFQNFIKRNHFDEVIVTGCCTDICVYDFCQSYVDYIAEHNLDTDIVIPFNCVDTFNGVNNDRMVRNIWALDNLAKTGFVKIKGDKRVEEFFKLSQLEDRLEDEEVY